MMCVLDGSWWWSWICGVWLTAKRRQYYQIFAYAIKSTVSFVRQFTHFSESFHVDRVFQNAWFFRPLKHCDVCIIWFFFFSHPFSVLMFLLLIRIIHFFFKEDRRRNIQTCSHTLVPRAQKLFNSIYSSQNLNFPLLSHDYMLNMTLCFRMPTLIRNLPSSRKVLNFQSSWNKFLIWVLF